jgi:hypothetical protein
MVLLDALIDVCGQTITVKKSNKKKLIRFLTALDISFGVPPIGHPFQNSTVQLFSEEDLNLVLLTIYGEMVDSSSLCRRPQPIVKNTGRSFSQPSSIIVSPSLPQSPLKEKSNLLTEYLKNQTASISTSLRSL